MCFGHEFFYARLKTAIHLTPNYRFNNSNSEGYICG